MKVGDLRLNTDIEFYQFNNVSFLKAYDADHFLNLSVALFTDSQMTAPLNIGGTDVIFDSNDDENKPFIEGLIVNNDTSQWKNPDDDGFNQGYNNAPVVLHLIDWINNKFNTPWKDFVASFSSSQHVLYAKYVWYWIDVNDNTHPSDEYSQILPAQAEQTARYSTTQTTTKRILQNSSQLVQCQWQDANSLDEDFSRDTYVAQPGKINILVDGIDMFEHDCIYLKDYDLGNEYKIKLTNNSNASTTLGDPSYVGIAGNGQFIEDLNKIEVDAGETCFISIQAGMIAVLARSKQNVENEEDQQEQR